MKSIAEVSRDHPQNSDATTSAADSKPFTPRRHRGRTIREGIHILGELRGTTFHVKMRLDYLVGIKRAIPINVETLKRATAEGASHITVHDRQSYDSYHTSIETIWLKGQSPRTKGRPQLWLSLRYWEKHTHVPNTKPPVSTSRPLH